MAAVVKQHKEEVLFGGGNSEIPTVFVTKANDELRGTFRSDTFSEIENLAPFTKDNEDANSYLLHVHIWTSIVTR